MYAVGGIDSRLTVSTTEYLDLHRGISKFPVQQNILHTNNIVHNETLISEWKQAPSIDGEEGMAHGGGTGIVSIGTMLYAISIYGTLEHDRLCDTSQQTEIR